MTQAVIGDVWGYSSSSTVGSSPCDLSNHHIATTKVEAPNIEFVTLSETEAYISQISRDQPDRYFQHILLGWIQFVAPLTPSHVDDILELKFGSTEPLENTPESVSALLWEVAFASGGNFSDVKTFSLWRKAWPSMWIWIDHIYHAHHAHRQIVAQGLDIFVTHFFARRYTIFLAVFTNLLRYDQQQPIVDILANYPRIFFIIADMWIREGTGKDGDGFRSGVFADPRRATHQRFLAEAMPGSAGEFVQIFCQRIERNLGQATPDYEMLSAELISLIVYMTQVFGLPCRGVAPAIYASSRVAAMLMQVWSHIASRPSTRSVEQRDELLRICVTATYVLVERSPQAYDRIINILDYDVLPLLIKSIPLVRSSSKKYIAFTAHAGFLIDEIICPATVHREMLYSIKRRVDASHRRGNFLRPTSCPKIVDSWSRLIKLLDDRKERYNEYNESARSVILCGNAECDNGSRGRLRRCSACRISLYCSKKCQRQHWVRHKSLCDDMKGKIQSCVDLSYPDLQYLSFLVVYDMQVQHFDYITSADVKDRAALPGSVPIFFLDYVKLLDCASSIDLLDANDKQPWFPFSDDQNLCKEWRQLLSAPKHTVPRFLVARIPRGAKGTAQTMTGAVVLAEKGAGQNSTLGIRWLHCQ